MKRIAWGIVAGGAVAAAFTGAATANATGGTWTPDYDVNDAQLFVGSGPAYTAAWELPASFTRDGTTLTGTDYLQWAPGGFNNEFITDDGAVYDQEQLGGGFTNLYYDADGSGDTAPVDMMKTPFGTFDVSSMTWLFAPDPDGFSPQSTAAEFGENIVLDQGTQARLAGALALVSGNDSAWTGGVADSSTLTPLLTSDSSLVWSAPATFTQSGADAAAPLSGTEYVTSPTNIEFVTTGGDIYDSQQLGGGLFTATNLYYDPTDGPAVDELRTLFGTINLSPIASWFAPDDVSDLTAPSPVSDLTDAGLYSALDLGLPDITS